MCNKAWKKLVDESENWIEFQVYLVEYLFDQQTWEEHEIKNNDFRTLDV